WTTFACTDMEKAPKLIASKNYMDRERYARFLKKGRGRKRRARLAWAADLADDVLSRMGSCRASVTTRIHALDTGHPAPLPPRPPPQEHRRVLRTAVRDPRRPGSTRLPACSMKKPPPLRRSGIVGRAGCLRIIGPCERPIGFGRG